MVPKISLVCPGGVVKNLLLAGTGVVYLVLNPASGHAALSQKACDFDAFLSEAKAGGYDTLLRTCLLWLEVE